VVIGGGEVGIETGMHLAMKGHKVTLLERGNKLAPDAPPAHFYHRNVVGNVQKAIRSAFSIASAL